MLLAEKGKEGSWCESQTSARKTKKKEVSMKLNYPNKGICTFGLNSMNIVQGGLWVKGGWASSSLYNWKRCRWKWRKAAKGVTLTLKWGVKSKSVRCCAMKEQTATVLRFPGRVYFFLLPLLCLSKPCLWLSPHHAQVLPPALLGPLGRNEVGVGPTKLGRNWVRRTALPTCSCFKAWVIIF